MEKKIIASEKLESFINGFYGFGNYSGPYWFVGIEPGGGDSFEDIVKRIQIWEDAKKPEVMDVAEYHLCLGIRKYFEDPVVLQPTWNRLIRIILSSKGYKVTPDLVRQYQKNDLGRIGKESCLIELLPLSSPRIKYWIMGSLTELKYLQEKSAYYKHCIPCRAEHIKKSIMEYRPKVVVFYGLAFFKYWKDIAEVDFTEESPDGIFLGRAQDTVFIIVKHPVAFGIKNDYFHRVGKLIVANNSAS
ncbi:MAG: hypothetical protein ABSE06_04605 [Anaerolineaceae bacterium]|jgi:hypothetical protein